MHPRALIVSLCTCFCISAQAEELTLRFEDALRTPEVIKVLKQEIKIQWGSNKIDSEILERAEPDIYRRDTLLGPSLESKCIAAFAKAIAAMVETATLMEYDTIADLHGIADEKRFADANSFICKSQNLTQVRLGSTFVLTRNGADNLRQAYEDPARQAQIRNRQLAPKVLLLPLHPILESAEAKAILRGIKTHIGMRDAPSYTVRSGPDTYSENASIKKFGPEGACQQAVLSTLREIVEEAIEQRHNGIIKIRSYYKDQWAPDEQKVECDTSGSSAEVVLMATTVKLK